MKQFWIDISPIFGFIAGASIAAGICYLIWG